METCYVVIVEEFDHPELPRLHHTLKSTISPRTDNPSTLVVQSDGSVFPKKKDSEELLVEWLGLFTLSAKVLLFEPLIDGVTLTENWDDQGASRVVGWSAVELPKSLHHERRRVILRGGDVVHFKDRRFRVDSRFTRIDDAIEAAHVEVQVGSSIPEDREMEVNAQDITEIASGTGTPQRSTKSQGYIIETPAKAPEVVREPSQSREESPSTRRGDLRGHLNGVRVNAGDEIEIPGTLQEAPEMQFKDESEADTQPSFAQGASISQDLDPIDIVNTDQDALPLLEEFDTTLELPRPLRHELTAEVPDSVPHYDSASFGEDINSIVGNSEGAPKDRLFKSRTIAPRRNENEGFGKRVHDSNKDDEAEVETESDSEDEAKAIAAPSAGVLDTASREVVAQGIVVLIPPSTKRKTDDDSETIPSNVSKKRSKAARTPAPRANKEKSSTLFSTPRNQSVSEEPSSSSRSKSPKRKESTKIAAQDISLTDSIPPFVGEAPIITFSNSTILDRPKLAKFVKNHCIVSDGSKASDDESALFDVLVVGKGELKKTSKLLKAIARGVFIVTDDWMIQSVKAGHLLALEHFAPTDTTREDDWGVKIADILGGGRESLFEGKTFHITPALKKEYGAGYSDIEELATLVGAAKVVSKPAKGFEPDEDTIVLGLEQGDKDVKSLFGKANCHSKDFLSISIIRGTVDYESEEFRLSLSSSQSSKSAATPGSQSKRKTPPSSNRQGMKAISTGSQTAKKRGRPPGKRK